MLATLLATVGLDGTCRLWDAHHAARTGMVLDASRGARGSEPAAAFDSKVCSVAHNREACRMCVGVGCVGVVPVQTRVTTRAFSWYMLWIDGFLKTNSSHPVAAVRSFLGTKWWATGGRPG